ncbi:hypothetical protein [Paraburkholderia sp. Cpub6]|uniref:hypothetical protein n=1 Tax=Paraburkholderia sp. Cpub6 TaxID=2723094 RepID=UPI001622CE5A|nr:hypothetical protein [Paraburkholderia sp. Cpub6]MBB5462279.1 hypothetical protein [Paraburkholderia sp. Cpub6]
MSRFPVPVIESAIGATADSYVRVSNVASAQVPNAFTASGSPSTASMDQLNQAERVQRFE